MTTDQPEVTQILPCPNPWCEALERTDNPNGFPPMVQTGNFNTHYVACSSCRMKGPTRQSEAKARAAWNTRQSHAIPGDVGMREAVVALMGIVTEGVSVDISDADLRAAHPEDRRFIKRTRKAMDAARAALTPSALSSGAGMKALLAVLDAVRDYLPPDGIPIEEAMNRIVGAVDNPEINPLIFAAENAAPPFPSRGL